MNTKEQLFLRYIKENEAAIFKVCRFYGKQNPDEVEDLYQEIVLNCWLSFSKFRNESKISTWIFQIALNTAYHYKKKMEKRPNFVELANHDFVENDSQTEQNHNIYEIIEQLSGTEKMITLMYLEEKSHQEIAEYLGISVSNVGTKINRIKKKLSKK